MAKRFLSNIRINDAYTFPASDGTDGQVIKTDGSGSLTFGQAAVNSASVMYKDTFTGDGSTTVFNMANALNDEVQSNIYIDGVYQSKSTYSVANKAITFSTAPLSGHAIEVISTTGINSGPTAIYTDTFTGNGSTTAFTLAQTVHSENQTLVFLNGVYQFKNTYTLSGTTLTLDTAPANSVAIEVMSIGSAYSGGDILYDHDFTSAGLMTTNGSGTYSISTAPTVGDGGLTQNNFTNTLKSKLDAIEASATADQTNAEIKAAVEAATDSNTFTDADHTKLNAIEASADVTDTTNVTAAGALMDSELAGIAAVKATTGTFLSADESKLDGIEASADVTDTANVTSAGALMDSELTNLAAVKAINQGLTTSSNVAFGNITATGYLRGPASFTIDPATHGDDTGTLVIAGNLQVDGTTTTINSTTVAIDDLNFSIATDAADSAAANGAGITIGGASATLLYTHATTSWDMNKPLNVTGNIGVSGTVDGVDIATRDAILTSTTTTAGAALPKAGGAMTGSITLNADNIDFIHGYAGNGLVLSHYNVGGSNAIVSGGSSNPDNLYINNGGVTSDWSNVIITGNVGIGTATPSEILHIKDSTNTTLNIEGDSAAGSTFINFTAGSNATKAQISGAKAGVSGGRLLVYTANSSGTSTERMRIDSSGFVTITNNPTTTDATLSLKKLSNAVAINDNIGYLNFLSNDASTSSSGGVGGIGVYAETAFNTSHTPSYMSFYTHATTTNDGTNIGNVTERMRIDSSGNVGIGLITPGAKLDVLQEARISYANANQYTLRITNTDGNPRILADGSAAHLIFGTTPSGSATAIERVRIQNAGNVGIGTTAPGGKLHIKGDGDVANLIRLQHDGPGTNGYFDINVTDSEANLIANYSTTAIPIRFLTAATERMRIESGGNVRVNFNQSGSAGNVYFQDVANGASMFYIQPAQYVGTAPYNTNYINAANSSNIGFITGGSERMRITSGGDILFRGTDVPSASYLIGSGFKYDSKSRATLVQASDNNTLTDLQEYFNTNGAVGKIQTSGSATIFNTSSDYRLKEDLKDFNGLDMVSNINVYDFKWKIDGKRSYGVLAHELQEIIPDAAAGEKDAVNEDGTINPQGVDYSKIVPILVKSIQELKAEIETLKTRLDGID